MFAPWRFSRFSYVALTAVCALAALDPNPAWAAAAAPAERNTTESESFIGLETMYASILDGLKPRGLLLVEFGLDVPDPEFRGQVLHALPLLRDAYVRSLIVYAATGVRPWRQPSVEDIVRRMQAITDQTMGMPGARVLMAQTAIRIND